MDEAPCKQEREKECAYWGFVSVGPEIHFKECFLTFMGA
jgi:hypothetical protein